MSFFNRFRASALTLSPACALLVSACGGGGGSATPTPTPIPTPTPTPTPSPAATAFSGAVFSTFIGRVFFDTDGDGTFGEGNEPTVFSNTFGEFGRDAANLPNIGSLPAPEQPTSRMSGMGIDTLTGLRYVNLTAPAGATVLTPLTTLIDKVGDQQMVRQALGLNTGPDAIRAGTNLLTFNPAKELSNPDPVVVQEAARIISINMQIAHVAVVATYPINGLASTADMVNGIDAISAVIRETGSARFSDAATMRAIVEKLQRFGFYSGEDKAFAADLMALYAGMLPDLLSDRNDIRIHDLTFRFFIASLATLRGTRSAPVTSDEIREMMAYFASTPMVDTSQSFFAVPDFVETSVDSSVLTECIGDSSHPNCNDLWFTNRNSHDSDRNAIIQSVSTDLTNQAKIGVTLTSGNKITIDRRAGFVGYAFFDYATKNSEGLASSSRVYVRFY